MGREIEKAALEKGHQIVFTLDNETAWSEIILSPETVDVVIDFSTPQSAAWVVNHCLDFSVPVVSGTTGWSDELEKTKLRCKSMKGAFFYAPNFSIGVNIFIEINRKLSSLMSNQEAYNASLHEIHHIHKLDAPSGTAIALANDLISGSHRYKTWNSVTAGQKDILPVTSERIGEVPGTHIIQWSSVSDVIELKHIALNRQGFAIGAVLAAEWLSGRQGMYGMADLLNTGT